MRLSPKTCVYFICEDFYLFSSSKNSQNGSTCFICMRLSVCSWLFFSLRHSTVELQTDKCRFWYSNEDKRKTSRSGRSDRVRAFLLTASIKEMFSSRAKQQSWIDSRRYLKSASASQEEKKRIRVTIGNVLNFYVAVFSSFKNSTLITSNLGRI